MKVSISRPGASSQSRKKSQSTTKDSHSELSSWTTEWITDWWGIEIVCWIIAALSLLAIVVLLETYKGKPLPQWPVGMTINSMVSIFATLGQMAMMKPVVECLSQLKWLWFVRKDRLSAFQALDDASRGPTGSLILLGKFRGLHLVCLGAAITVVSIGFGPFAQQVVTYPPHLHPTGNSSTPQVLLYTGLESAGGHSSSEMISALFSGLSNQTQNFSTITPSCSTGNCTWDSYASLGVCSGVVDLSSFMTPNPCNETILDELIEFSTGAPNPGWKCFNYTIPVLGPYSAGSNIYTGGNLSVSNTISTSSGATTLAAQTLSLNSVADPLLTINPEEFGIYKLPNATNTHVLHGYLLYQPGFYTAPNFTLPEPVAYELTLDFCLQTFNTSVSKGVANTTLISSQPLDATLLQSKIFDVTTGSNLTQGTVFNGSDFGFSLGGLLRLQLDMQVTLPDQCYEVLSDPATLTCGLWTGAPFATPALTGLNSTSAERYAAVEHVMNNLAISMTNAFRLGGGNDTQVVEFQGTTLTPLIYVEAQYYWLILPITLVSLTLVFLLATILKSQRLGSRIWKSSNLATLQGLDIHLHAKLGEMSSISDMDEKTKNVNVRFDGKVEGGVKYRLLEVQQEACWRG